MATDEHGAEGWDKVPDRERLKMKSYILKDEDFARLLDVVRFQYIPLEQNGTTERHSEQAREHFRQLVERWIDGVKR